MNLHVRVTTTIQTVEGNEQTSEIQDMASHLEIEVIIFEISCTNSANIFGVNNKAIRLGV